ncbi:MAG: right-handed parallel beta-helix repeat-containing protein [Planctomycetota bacterium]|jgi:hypothetical protein
MRAKITTVFFVACTGLAQAATITVGPGAGYDFTAIQAAINAAEEGDIVLVDAGTYNESIAFNGANIILTSMDPNDPQVVESTIINATNNRRVVTFSGSEDTSCVLKGFTITDGHAADDYGGGIWGGGTRATIKNCVIGDNNGDFGGGGLYDCDGPISDCVIAGNYARGGRTQVGKGGGLYECDGPIVKCSIMGNQAGSSGRTGYGGGLSSCNGSITGCTIRYNWAGAGGGLYDCRASITECTISDNLCNGYGGGLYRCNGRISDCTISGNKAEHETSETKGGGLYACGGTISNCIISSNSAQGLGGGLYACDGTISNCIISGNSAEESGGGLYGCNGLIESCTIVDNKSPNWHGGGAMECNLFKDCVITNNSSRGHGGGLHECRKVISCTITGNSTDAYPGGGLSQCDSVANCIVSGNIAGENGGGLHNCAEVFNCTIVGNYAVGQGSAIYQDSDHGVIANSIIWDNRAGNGGQILVGGSGSSSAPCSISIRYSNIQGGLGTANVAGGCELQWAPTYFDMGPLFVQPGRWASGTEWIEGDYHLLAGSPCIDEGDPEQDYSGQTDIDGRERVFGQRVDIGADEYVAPVLVWLDIAGSGEVEEGASAQFTATAYYDDDSAIDVTNQATWSVEPEGFGVVDAKGLFTVGELDESIQLIIKAEYGEGQVVREAQKLVLCVALPEPPGIYHVDGTAGSNDNDGLSWDTAFKTVQRGIDAAKNGNTVLVYPGVYVEEVRFKGKAITVASAEDAAILENPGDFAVSFYYGEGTDSVLENFIIRHSVTAVFVAGSSPTISNLTIVDNQYGIEAYAGPEPDISNCIFWSNSDGDMFGCQARYSCIERGSAGEGNIDAGPLFVDPNAGDYHLVSERGRYWPEYNVWVLDEATSPCIDGGDPNSDYSNERTPNGGRINIGAYGGTAYASMSELRFTDDINHDGIIDIVDLIALVENWLESVGWLE